MNGTLSQGAWKVGTIMGIPLRVHFSWFSIFGLITWSLSTFYFPQAAPDLPEASYWLKGVLAALLLFASVGFHELAHSFVAKKYKISIESIALFIFGGVARTKREPPHPKEEDIMKALELMISEDKGRIAVTKNEGIIELITRSGISRYVQIKGK